MPGNGEFHIGRWKMPFTLEVTSETTGELGQSVDLVVEHLG
jgi:hypothetical protein